MKFVASLIAAALLALPAGAAAALPSGSVADVDWDVRHTWVNYVTNPAWYGYLGQGTVTRTGGSASVTGYGATTWSSPWVNTQYGTNFDVSGDSTASGKRTVALKGGLDFDMSAHSIDISLSDVRVVKESGGREHIVLDASYVPLGGSKVTNNDLDFADLVDVSGGPTNQLQLTSGGATVFNGGSNGSYKAGSEFGRLVYH